MGKKSASASKIATSDDDANIATSTENAKAGQAKKTTLGLNWTALGFLFLFTGTAVITAGLTVMDYLYPETAKVNRMRQRLVRCYTAAKPDKLGEIETILGKYKGRRESDLYNKLRATYEKFPQCS